MSLGKRIKAARSKAGLTQAQLAEILGLSAITIRQYETDKRQPRLEQLREIADALGVLVSEIAEESGTSPSQNEADSKYLRETREKAGENLKRIREMMGINQESFAKLLGISRAALSGYENGTRSPDIDFINLVKKKTGCSANYLLGLTTAQREDSLDFEGRFNLSGPEADELNKICRDSSFRYFLRSNAISRVFARVEERSFEAAVDYDDFNALIYGCLQTLRSPIEEMINDTVDRIKDNPDFDSILDEIHDQRHEFWSYQGRYLKPTADTYQKDPFESFRKAISSEEDI